MFILLGRRQSYIAIGVFMVCVLLITSAAFSGVKRSAKVLTNIEENKEKKDFIKWVDFNVPYEALDYAVKLDIKYHDTETPVSYVELLAYTAAKNGNNFKGFKTAQLDTLVDKIKSGKTIECISDGLKYYDFYCEAYTAILSGLVGEYEIEVDDESSETGKRWERKYGIKAFSPFAKGFYYREYDDFGAGRSYGFNRRHLGHDMIGSVGTPIVAVEGGMVEELGWNQYGGWRIGIRSHDKKRYYYYAHFRKDFPYNKDLKIGGKVAAGDVIGYLGRTGYSVKENVNNIDVAHLHIGLQLIFDESQKNCQSEIWIDVFPITKLLSKNRSTVKKDEQTKEYSRVYGFREVLDD
ncbi:MAG TPA: M23 family metallopeptidase [Oscillospiraceae bacterium]|nr:M23 family metallopeptidase [Oscillospiraceae bacterium]